MNQNGVSRVNYFDRQFLRVQDFVDEQTYEVAMRRRHNVAEHNWGIVSGLQLDVEDGSLFVQPGMAIDGFGRELILAEKQPLPVSAFNDKQSDQLGVWLVYNLVGTDPPPPGYTGCGNGTSGLFYRWQEQPLIWLLVPDPAHPDPREPKQIQTGDINFDPTLTPPDDPQRSWPVFLGLITRDLRNPQPYSVDLSGRPYVGLVGESVAAPSGRATVQVGSEKAADDNRFAVFIPEAGPDPQLAVDKAGNLSVHGETTVYGDLTVSGGTLEFGVGQANSPQPWRIYQHLETQQNNQMRRELRIEIDGGTQGNNQVVIGLWSSDENKFKPCLTVADDFTVTVHGNLVVEGTIEVTPNQFVPGIPSPQAKSFLTGSYLAGLSGSPVLLAQTGAATMYADVGMRAAAHAMSTDPGQLAKFADMVKKDFSKLAAELHEKLRI
jgi:hypothetical protein